MEKILRTWHDKHKDSLSFGERLADSIAAGMGSWRFIIIQSIVVILWMTLNTIAIAYHWDVYPFILLNLLFSTQAAYAAPIIMMAQNRAADRDKIQAEHQYETQELELKMISQLLEENTRLTKEIHELANKK